MGVRVWALLGSLLLATGCSADSEPESSRSTESSETTRATPTPTDARTASVEPTRRTSSAAVDGTTIVVDESEYGPMLYDGTGQAIYMFDVETTADPRCYDDCAVAWPPVLTEGEPVAADGADRALLGTTERADGRLQVTYNDHPLYFYAHEGKHEVLCHDVFLNGGNWYVVQPGGDPAPPA